MNRIKEAYSHIDECDSILIGAGAGLSAAAGLDIGINAVRKVMPEYEKEYGITDMYQGSFYPFVSINESLAYWSKAFYYWRYQVEVFQLYRNLLELVGDRNYFVITTNGDGQFMRSGFDRKRLFLVQGDHGEFACSRSCCDETYDAKPIFESMINHTVDFKVPGEYIPRCPHCKGILMMRQRSGVKNLEIKPYLEERQRYVDFLNDADNCVLLELGVGFDTPIHIKYPFWQMCLENRWKYISVNLDKANFPQEISDNTIYLQRPIDEVISEWLELKR